MQGRSTLNGINVNLITQVQVRLATKDPVIKSDSINISFWEMSDFTDWCLPHQCARPQPTCYLGNTSVEERDMTNIHIGYLGNTL